MSVTLPAARPIAELDLVDEHRHRRELAQVLKLAMQGHTNTSLFVTLEAGAATTTVSDARISIQTCASFMPQTAHAAAEIPTLYAVCEAGLMTIYHTNNAQTDRTYTVGITG